MIVKYSRYRRNPPVGTLVTCENGHVICEIIGRIHDFKTKTSFSGGFGVYRPGQHIAKPGDGAAAFVCSICDAPWIAERQGIAKLHLQDGWWPRPQR